jgi:hypothetical protein
LDFLGDCHWFNIAEEAERIYTEGTENTEFAEKRDGGFDSLRAARYRYCFSFVGFCPFAFRVNQTNLDEG